MSLPPSGPTTPPPSDPARHGAGRRGRRASPASASGEPILKIPLDQLVGVTAAHLEAPLLARLDASNGLALFAMPPTGGGGDPTIDRTLRDFAEAVLNANKRNLQKGRLQRELPYWTSFLMNVVLFLIGVLAFGLAIYRAAVGDPLTAAAFGGVTLATIVTTFLLGPVSALQKSNLLNTSLVCVINTYWTRLMYLENPLTIDADLKRVTDETVAELDVLFRTYLKADTSKTGSKLDHKADQTA